MTEFNVKKITQGWADSPLVPQGVDVAKKLGDFFKDKAISKIYTSDLGRCVQTSEIINQSLRVEIVTAAGLREQNFGKFNGIDDDVIAKEFDRKNCSAIPLDGESFLQMKERVLSYIKTALPRDSDNILIVTHTGGFQSILSDSLKVNFDAEECRTTPSTVGLFELSGIDIKFIKKYDLG